MSGGEGPSKWEASAKRSEVRDWVAGERSGCRRRAGFHRCLGFLGSPWNFWRSPRDNKSRGGRVGGGISLLEVYSASFIFFIFWVPLSPALAVLVRGLPKAV